MHQGLGEGRVAPGAVEGDVAGLGGEADQGADARFDRCQSSGNRRRSGSEGSGQIACQGVVAAGVEEEDVGLGRSFHHALDELKRHGLELERGGGFELGVDGHEVVLPRDLQSMPRIEEEPDFRPVQGLGKVPDLAVHGGLIEVQADDGVKAEALEDGGHVGRVVTGVAQRVRVPVGGVADDERHARLRGRRQ